MVNFSRLVIGLLAVISSVAAQELDLPAFEVASIKPQTGDSTYGPSSPDRFTNPAATLRSLIAYAYDVRDFQIDGGPDWAGSREFDVNARAPGAVGQAAMRLMMRRLLAERFALRTHTESRELPMYVLVKARADGRLGEGLQPAAVDCAAILAARAGAPPPGQGDGSPECAWRVGIAPPVARMMVDGAPMREFAGLLERLVGRRVVDETGLTGTFNVRLEFSSDLMPLPVPPSPDATSAPPRDGLSLFTALEEQLGLKLDSTRGPVPVIVVDSAELPAPD